MGVFLLFHAPVKVAYKLRLIQWINERLGTDPFRYALIQENLQNWFKT